MAQPRILLVLAVAALVAAGTAGAAGPVVLVALSGGQGVRSAACGGDTDRYAVVPHGHRVVVSGTVSPRPRGGWHVLVRVKRCVAGKFKTTWTRNVAGATTGKFHVAYLATTPGTFFARAEYGTKPTAESNKQRFSVK